MEWCLDCHRNPAKNLRPTSQIYNMAWEAPSEDKPVWCSVNDKSGVPTAQMVDCVTKKPEGVAMTMLQAPKPGSASAPAGDVQPSAVPVPANYQEFTSQDQLGHFLLQHYKIRTPKELTSCEVCHR
jgi:hypothetical protein